MSQKFSRRDMIATSGLAAAAMIVPRHVLGGPGFLAPSDKPMLAAIGVGGVGFGQVQGCEKAGFQVSVLCDVDDNYAKKAYDRWPQARRYRDFREMLQAEGDRIDAVYCGTPDHSHAVISLAALKHKKHLCCVKPITRTLVECQTIVEAAREAGVATQVTASPNTGENGCRTSELIWGGAIGQVREVHIWSNRPLWPQGMLRPEGRDPIPKTLDWDLWLGPAQERPYVEKWPDGHLAWAQINSNRGTKSVAGAVYHPWNFRGWWDFGTGALGDMGCHHVNTPYRALKLTAPTRIKASATRVFEESAPLASIVTYDFPARGEMEPVRIVWYDGGLQPPCPPEIPNGWLPAEGTLYLGDQGKMLGSRVLTPEAKKRADSIPKTLQRRGGTWPEWFEACQGGQPAGCNFDWAAGITEFVLLGNLAIRTGQPLDWEADTRHFTNGDEANKMLHCEYRDGWTL